MAFEITTKTRNILLFFAAVIILFPGTFSMPKQAVADVQGKTCVEDSDCPCWGTYGEGDSAPRAYGLGVSRCVLANNSVSKTCDTTYCVDVQPVGEWVRDNPWKWIRENPLYLLAIIGAIVLILMTPKR